MKPKYQVGDKVKIKDELPDHSLDHSMQKYTGTVMTVRKVVTRSDGDLLWYRMEEDKEEDDRFGWAWFDSDIAGLAEEFEDPEPFDDSAFPEITFEELLAGTIPERRTS